VIIDETGVMRESKKALEAFTSRAFYYTEATIS